MHDIQELLAEAMRRHRLNKRKFLFTDADRHLYPKHVEFMAAGAKYKQRLFRAGNRIGKTTAAAYEVVCHLTGLYPDWWTGHRFNKPNQWWVCGDRQQTVRSTLQPMLLGPVTEFGTGMIPYDCLDFDTLKDAQKADTSISMIRVKHISGGWSQVEFKTYESGRKSFESAERSIWFDEEPPAPVYQEALMRTMTGNNITIMTFTPLQGASEVVKTYSKNGDFAPGEIDEFKYVVAATWDEAPHLSDDDKRRLLADIPPFQRAARSKGIPSLGAGAIYPLDEDDYLCDPFTIPESWKRLYGMDVGGKTAAVWLALNPDTKEVYAYAEYYKEREEPSMHVIGIKAKGDWIPGVIDPASRGRSQIDGKQLFQMYTDLGLELTNAKNAVETGLYQVWEALSTGRLKVFRGLTKFMEEMRSYSRDEKGHVIKKNDHLMDAFRYAFMGLEHAKSPTPKRRDHAVSPRYRITR